MTTTARRSRWMGLAASLAAIVAVLVHVSWAPADPLIGPTPATTNAQLSVTTSTNNVADGTAIHFTVTTSGPATLNLVEAHICVHGFSTYTLSNFNFSGSTGIRCVYGSGIDTGSLNSVQPNYKLGPIPFSAVTTSGDQSFAVGSGAVTWFNASSFPGSLTCGASSECDLVVRVGLTGDPDVTDTFFIQPICFAGGSCSSGTTTTTSAGTTSTTGATTTTAAATTTTAGATTTTAGATTTTAGATTTTAGATTTTTGGGAVGTTTTLAGFVSGSGSSSTGTTGSTSSGSLAFTGSSTRNVVSIALLILALGLFFLGQASRRRGASTR